MSDATNGTTVEFANAIGDQVKIIRSGGVGEVVGLYSDREHVLHASVEYATTAGEVKTAWFREADICPFDGQQA